MYPYDTLHVMNTCAKGKQSLTTMILVIVLYECNFQQSNTKLIDRKGVKYLHHNLEELIGLLKIK